MGRAIWGAPTRVLCGPLSGRSVPERAIWRAHKVARPRARIMRANEGPEKKGVLMLDNPQSLAGIITKHSSKSVAQTVDRLTRVIADRGFTLFRVIDHSGTAERLGLQMPDSKLVMFGKPTVGAAVMLAAPLGGLGFPLT